MEIFTRSHTIEEERSTPRRMVVKIGTSTLCEESGIVRTDFVKDIAEQVLALRNQGIQTLLVSSGAGALGTLRQQDIQDKRLAAALGQPVLMQVWNKAFYPMPALQFLFSDKEVEDEITVKHLLTSALDYGIPVINGSGCENNDTIAAKIAKLIDADALVLLTNKPGVLDQRGRTVPLVRQFGEVAHLIKNGQSCGGSFGMGPKVLEASSFAQVTGNQAYIAHGHQPRVLEQIFTGQHQGITRFGRV